jgi:CHASE2 domain-containing sensor protein
MGIGYMHCILVRVVHGIRLVHPSIYVLCMVMVAGLAFRGFLCRRNESRFGPPDPITSFRRGKNIAAAVLVACILSLVSHLAYGWGPVVPLLAIAGIVTTVAWIAMYSLMLQELRKWL